MALDRAYNVLASSPRPCVPPPLWLALHESWLSSSDGTDLSTVHSEWQKLAASANTQRRYLFALAVAHLLTAQAPTVRSKVADTGTSPDISGLP